MPKPQFNPHRQMLPLASFWDFRFDTINIGKTQGWMTGLSQSVPIAVPASWNDQLGDGRDNLGPAWYQTTFDLAWGWEGQRILLRFNSVNYLAEVWLIGGKIGEHEGGYLPFDIDITNRVKQEGNLLVVRVDGTLAPERVPPGAVPPMPGQDFANQCFKLSNCSTRSPMWSASTCGTCAISRPGRPSGGWEE